MVQENRYPIGITGQQWGEAEKALWLTKQTIKRSYQAEVAAKIAPLAEHFQVDQYGALSYNTSEYPLFVVKSQQWSEDKPTVLVTGGVHGYETSGVQGAIRFLETKAKAYEDRFNILVAPCISPWGYETINRWNPNAVDPNRSFYRDSPAEESAALMAYIADLGIDITVHIDLHETTDTDNSAFRPALAARDAVEHTNWNIPDGFYLVGNTELPAEAFQTAIIESVEKVTHIAPADNAGKLIGVVLSQFGVINYATKALGLCIGFSDSIYATTTEVYPDSPKVDDENCILAQVAAITGGLDYILPLS
ncbi:M14 family metallocarboxypeptidase [Shewanella benthica]|uniref:M14 family metallopeptidase n=1 Tax=Shewanella benthica TaxID=43661 RepID=UPI0018798398|nr:M14 family metallocarboxypeptidase [Shewanella benthica]MBE7216735.1 M14 family metallocarboxypeptidase [Shewanella benthica]MCL1061592.1 M14 family metallocarboxypeptidase [Shewanella benthica]